MRALVQRVSSAGVTVAGAEVARIEQGLLVLLGVYRGDGAAQASALAEKVVHLRIFADADKPMNRSLLDVGGAALVVSQFTLAADTRRGRRPGFADAAPPELAEPLYETFVEALRGHGPEVATGVFGADMQVALVNDGPVTLLLEKHPA